MPSWFDVGNIWKTLREVDLRPIRAQAERVTRITIIGGEGNARARLVASLCENPAGPSRVDDASHSSPSPISLSLAEASKELDADLVILIVNSTQYARERELELFAGWRNEDKVIIVIFERGEAVTGFDAFAGRGVRLIRGSALDRGFIDRELVPAVLTMLPDHHLSLARYYPLFRLSVAQQLIAETSTANASYALTTGLAEIVPILDVPFNVADMIILTKAQALMSYKLGLALGLSGNWQDHVAAFGSTIGSGFLWRQIARQLVGLIPVWGIIPKVAIAYAGTYVLGQAILQWYLTGRQVTPARMRELYREAFDQGKAMARTLMSRVPRRRKMQGLSSRPSRTCENCGAANPGGFNYCGNCGSALKVAS